MKYKIIHLTEYDYSSEVFLEPHYFRFKPKFTSYCTINSFTLDVKPGPAGMAEFFDVENNLVHLAWFEGVHRKLTIRTEALIEISEFNPFGFLIYPEDYTRLPFKYPEDVKKLLGPALKDSKLPSEIIKFGKKVMEASNNSTITFLLDLTRQIFSEFKLEYRMTGQPHDPQETYLQRMGSCRDLAWFEIHLLRHFGIAARFVSGYYYIPMDEIEFELHAWLEVYLPGAGWIGFDPSHGVATGNDHIPIAISSDFAHSMPVTGSVRGDAEAKLKTDLTIERIV